MGWIILYTYLISKYLFLFLVIKSLLKYFTAKLMNTKIYYYSVCYFMIFFLLYCSYNLIGCVLETMKYILFKFCATVTRLFIKISDFIMLRVIIL